MVDDEDLFGGFADETRIASPSDVLDAAAAGPVGALHPEPFDPNLRPRLQVEQADGSITIIGLEKPLVLLGRVAGVVDIVVSDDAASRHHAAIAHSGGVFTLYDMGSTNGTMVDGETVEKCELKNGSRIQIGETGLTFLIG